ncbi:Beta-secretase 2 [Cladochytrium tenue]|nr:Beta-secretase 2 [Cladochytrium tenue]
MTASRQRHFQNISVLDAGRAASAGDATQTLDGGPLVTGCWRVPVVVGASTFNALVDSGSSDLAIPGPNLDGYDTQAPTYNPSGQTPVRSASRQTFYDGSWWQGDFYSDSVSLGGAKAPATFAVIKFQSQPAFTDGRSSQGLIGIAFDSLAQGPLTVLSSMVKSGAISQDAVGFRGCPATTSTPSVISWGASTSSSLTCSSDTQAWVPLTGSTYFSVNVVGMAVAGSGVSLPSSGWQPTNSPSIVDSCTTLLLLPDFALSALAAAIKSSGVLNKAGLSSLNVDKFLYGGYGYRMNIDFSSLPEISFDLQGSGSSVVSLTLTGGSYIQGDGRGYFYFAVGSIQTQNVIFGGITFDTFYVVLDRANRRVGFSPGCDCDRSVPDYSSTLAISGSRPSRRVTGYVISLIAIAAVYWAAMISPL